MGKHQLFTSLLLVAAVALLFTACGGSSGDYYQTTLGESAPGAQGDYEMEPAYDDFDGGSQASAGPSKRVKTGSMEMAARDVNYAVTALEDMARDYGGYVEHRSKTVNELYEHAALTLRIPAESYESFVQATYDIGEVLDFYDTVEDLSGQYADLSLRLNSCLAEETRLLELIEKAENIEDVIKLEMRLGEVRMDIASYENSLNDIDRKVSLSTLHINIGQKSTPTIRPIGEGLPKRMSAAFQSSARGLLRFGEGIVITLVYWSAPLVLILICTLVGRLVYKKIKK